MALAATEGEHADSRQQVGGPVAGPVGRVQQRRQPVVGNGSVAVERPHRFSCTTGCAVRSTVSRSDVAAQLAGRVSRSAVGESGSAK